MKNFTKEQQTIIKYNNLVNNNILYTPYIKSIYISGINNNSDKYYYIAQNKLHDFTPAIIPDSLRSSHRILSNHTSISNFFME